jgi:hypothetical protein
MENHERTETAVDAAFDRRPGVPEDRSPGGPAGHAHWSQPAKQPPRADVLKDAGRSELTATFGTGQPPRGVSGMLRRAAYRMPDYEARRWALLLFADRVDAFETRARELAIHPATWVAVAAAVGLAGAMRTKKKRRSLF